MKKVANKAEFGFHDRCKELKLNHLCFADDVLLFCKGNLQSIRLMLQGLRLFSSSSGLLPNNSKSAIYCAGMPEAEIQRVVQISGFTRSSVPFKYLGIPICSKRISKAECNILVDKMTARIKIWSTRHISFAGRAVLINSVLLTIHTYWSQILVLPKKVVAEIERICRSFLWKGSNNMLGAGAVAWNKVCLSKAEGGIGFLNINTWNKAALMKNIWTLAAKKDNLWVKWIHSVYLKNDDCWNHKASIHSSWYWRKLVDLKDEMRRTWDTNQLLATEFKIADAYKKLQLTQDRTHWCNQVWSRLNHPKHSFILWMAVLDRLKTRDRLKRMQITDVEECCFCSSQPESKLHLFFQCSKTSSLLQQMKDWIGWKAPAYDLNSLIRSISRSKRSKFQQQVFSASIAGLVYFIWQQRNGKIWQQSPKSMNIQELKWHIKTRISCVLPKKIKVEDRIWFDNL
ncbi:hypothetical protein CsatB_016699 [Cannabis sativa]